MLPVENLIAMAGFALAASATPGPVNIIGAMVGAQHGAPRALPFVSGATAGFLALLLGLGSGMVAGPAWILTLATPMTLIGSAYLLWMAWGLIRDAGLIGRPERIHMPGFWSGVVIQCLNPKAWLAVFASLSTFVLPLHDQQQALVVFAALFGLICWLSLAAWAWGGARIPQSKLQVFNRAMALLLILSVLWMLKQTLLKSGF